jgi:6-phosphofructokinase
MEGFMYNHKKIAITGGPCAGKTTAMQKIVQEFTEKGYKVFVVSEAATELINGGIRPFGDGALPMYEFQKCIIDMQLSTVSFKKEPIEEPILQVITKLSLFSKLILSLHNKELVFINEYEEFPTKKLYIRP